ncbi:MAG: hypothetical protein U5Q03_13910 [Bacteroidota bacterium]|nr:hypothetical protein [Bacteroidota bacterium]
MKKFFTILVRLLIILLALLGSFLVYISVNDYVPPERIRLNVIGPRQDVTAETCVFSFFSWNIGYAGLGMEMDFFYEGGKQVRPGEEQLTQYWQGIGKTLNKFDSLDFVLLQEVDVRSKRSYFMDQQDSISGIFSNHYESFAINYDVSVVPVPLLDPMGTVKAGMMSLSRFKPSEVERIAYPNIAGWPRKLFLPDRCFIYMRIPAGEKDLLVVNTHNSFYVQEKELRQQELDILKEFILQEYNKGNYVVAGGDWNQNPPALEVDAFSTGDRFEAIMAIEPDFLPPGWKFVYDSSIPTNRQVDEVYEKASTPTTIIDYFVVSPNVLALEAKTLDLGFENADHQPVIMKVRLENEDK